jgi:hypothetical protein
MDEENGMSGIDVAAIERIVANTIVETARGDPDALAFRIVAALAEAGYRIVPVNLIEDTALGSQPFDERPRCARRIPTETAGIGRSGPASTGATSPTTCPRPSKRPTRRGVGRSMSRSLAAARSWSRGRVPVTITSLAHRNSGKR